MTYKYVYSLSYGGQVFYIGCAKDVVKRYKQHLRHTWQPTDNAKHISDLLKRGVFPDLNIITYLPEYEAQIKEITLIKIFSSAGQNLMNHQNKRYRVGGIGAVKAKCIKRAIKIVKYHQEMYIYYNHNKDENGNTIIKQYPSEPEL